MQTKDIGGGGECKHDTQFGGLECKHDTFWGSEGIFNKKVMKQTGLGVQPAYPENSQIAIRQKPICKTKMSN